MQGQVPRAEASRRAASGGLRQLFAKGKEGIKESKLRVAYTQPPPPTRPASGGRGDARGRRNTAATLAAEPDAIGCCGAV